MIRIKSLCISDIQIGSIFAGLAGQTALRSNERSNSNFDCRNGFLGVDYICLDTSHEKMEKKNFENFSNFFKPIGLINFQKFGKKKLSQNQTKFCQYQDNIYQSIPAKF